MTPSSIILLDLAHGVGRQWSQTVEIDDFHILAGSQYFSAGKSFSDDNTYKTSLYHVQSGQLLKSYREEFDTRPIFFAVSMDQQYAFVRRTYNLNPLICNVNVYRIGQWEKPVQSFSSLPGGPFAADRCDAAGITAFAYMKSPSSHDPDSMTVILDIVDMNGNEIYDHVFEPSPVDWYRSDLKLDSTGHDLRLLFYLTQYHFRLVN
jgi:hypothetical protein